MMSNSSNILRKGSKEGVVDRDAAWVAGEITGFTGKHDQVITHSGNQSSLSMLEEKNSLLQSQLIEAKEDASNNLIKLREVEKRCLQLQQKLKSYEKFWNMDDEILRRHTLSLKGNQPSNTKHYYIKRLVQENSEIILRCIKENLGFKDGKPVAASVIYKFLLHWHAFEAESTAIFGLIIENIMNAHKEGYEGVTLPYWLSNASALLCLLQRLFQSNGFCTPSRRSGVFTLCNGRDAQGYTPHRYDIISDVMYPALMFKPQLIACVKKIYGLIRDNLKMEMSPLLISCIEGPKNKQVNGGKPFRSPSGMLQKAADGQWEKIIEFLNSLMDCLRGNHVPSFFIRKLITQVFSFINISLFNSILSRPECCTFFNGEFVKSGLAELGNWIANAKEEFAVPSWHELIHIRQAVRFLVTFQKWKMSLEEIRHDLCPALTVRQLYSISTMYWDDIYGSQSVSNEVVAEMREILNKESLNFTPNSFLLDDDLSIPFSEEDIYMMIPAIDPTDIDAPAFLYEYPSAQYPMFKANLFKASFFINEGELDFWVK